LAAHENNPRTVRMARRKNAKVVALVEANIAGPLVCDDVHSGRLGIRSLCGKCFNESGTGAAIAAVRGYIDVQMARVRCAIWPKRLVVTKIIENRIKCRIFEASGKISNQDAIVGKSDEKTVDVVIEVANKPFRLE